MLSQTRHLSTLLRRAPELKLQWARSAPAASITSINNQPQCRPLFSLADSTKHLRGAHVRPSNDHLVKNCRSASTGSSTFAPVTPLTETRRTQLIRDPPGNTNVFESSDHLPSLPVPDLRLTLERLAESISPVVMNSAEFVQTLRLIDDFRTSAGPKLDLLLRSKASQKKNWLADDWWIQDTYLKSRQPLVINSNPAMIYPSFPFEVNNQRALINTTAHLISGLIDFKLALLGGYNPEAADAHDEFRLDANLCYNQYRHIFGSTRVPNLGMDSIQLAKVESAECHRLSTEPISIVVSFRGRFFEVQLNSIDDEKARSDQLVATLEKIIIAGAQDEDIAEGLAGVGALTAANRDDWARVYPLLEYDSVKAIQQAEFVVCIDSITEDSSEFSSSLLAPGESSDVDQQHAATLGRQILHADGANVGNRWFDKAIQLIVVADGKAERLLGAGINYEHTCAEGTIINRMIEYSYDRAVQRSREQSNGNFFTRQPVSVQPQPALFRQLKMLENSNLEQVATCLKRAREDHLAHIAQFDLSYLDYRHYGSNSIKSWNLSPDSWMQVAILSGYYNLHRRFGACYESASTRQFAYGRTETIRSLTKEVAQYCVEPSHESLLSAIRSHKSYARSANNGDAIDRVLWGYRMTFNELRSSQWLWGIPDIDHKDLKDLKPVDYEKARQKVSEHGVKSVERPLGLKDVFTDQELDTISAFFNNELIKRSTRFALSTSQVSSIHPGIYMTYGPILADGYGCCYNITGQRIVAAITANSSNQSFSCKVGKLNESIKLSLDKMRDIMEENRSKSGNK